MQLASWPLTFDSKRFMDFLKSFRFLKTLSFKSNFIGDNVLDFSWLEKKRFTKVSRFLDWGTFSVFDESLGYIILNQEQGLNTLPFCGRKNHNYVWLSKNHSQSKPVEQLLTFRQPYPTGSKWCIDDIYSWCIDDVNQLFIYCKHFIDLFIYLYVYFFFF